MSTQITGLNETLQAIADLESKITRGAKRGLNQWSEGTMTEAKNRAPVDDGILKGSGYVTPPEESGGVISQELGFGGAAADYALVQHEDLTLNHSVGQAKFLESAVSDREHELIGSVAAEIEREVQ
jgi:hypothetical protein